MKFVDYAKIYVKSGGGGKGHVSFRREKFVPKGGPDGGNGGKGGDVIFEADPHLATLLDFQYLKKYEAENGKPGKKSNQTGKDGKPVKIRVPQGTVIKKADTEEPVADLTEPYQTFTAAEGGKGGKGNAEFATAVNQTPRYAQPGLPGEEKELILELKLLADIGLVGLPNVGKSTLISVISAAKPKIADYHFTTLVPNLGIVSMGLGKSFTVADIPGLIEGAHKGKGLGIQFLRHVERTKSLVFLIDCMSTSPDEDYRILTHELYKYSPGMKDKRRIICFSKTDVLPPEELSKLNDIDFNEPGARVMKISAVTGKNIEKLKHLMWESQFNLLQRG